MRVYLASAGVPPEHTHVPRFERLAELDRVGRHRLVDDPATADAVLFVECHQLPGDWQLNAIRRSQLNSDFSDRTYVYNEQDRPWCALPGLYVSMPRSSLLPKWQAPAPYFHFEDPRSRLPAADPGLEPDLLFSFVGSRTHACREEILRLRHPRALVESVDGFLFHDSASVDYAARRVHYAEVLLRSKFVLCPRGHGTSSIRLFETLAAGRVPVVISDDWVPPPGPLWNRIAVTWPQARISELPDHLERIESEAAERGALAKAAYCENYAPDRMFDSLVTELEQLALRRAGAPFPIRGIRDRRFFRLACSNALDRARSSAARGCRRLQRRGG